MTWPIFGFKRQSHVSAGIRAGKNNGEDTVEPLNSFHAGGWLGPLVLLRAVIAPEAVSWNRLYERSSSLCSSCARGSEDAAERLIFLFTSVA